MIDKRYILLQISEILLILILANSLYNRIVAEIYYTEETTTEGSVTQNIIIREPAMVKVVGDTNMYRKRYAVDNKEGFIEYQLIEFNGNIKQNDIDQLKEEIDTTIPTWLLESFIKNGWKIVLTSQKTQDYMDKKWANISVLALTDYRNKKIVISKKAIHTSVAHEFGHYLDVTYIYKCSDSDEFATIYNEEIEKFKKKIDNPECVFNKAEFFAEAYYYSRVDRSKCTPKVLEYIDKVSKSYEEGSHI